VFASTQQTAANQLVRLRYAGEIRRTADSGYSTLEDFPDAGRAKLFMEEAERRALDELTSPDPRGMNWDTFAAYGRKGVFFYMLTSIKSAMAQMTQMPIVGIPYFAARYGFADTVRILKTYGNIFEVFSMDNTPILENIGQDEHGALNPTWREANIANSKYVQNKPEAERNALRYAYDWADAAGLFMSTYTMDMTRYAKQASAHYESTFGKGMQTAGNFITGAFHHSEAITRKMMFMSAFELELARAREAGIDDEVLLNDDGTSKGDSDTLRGATAAEIHAREEAEQVVNNTLFKYTEHNRAAFMKGPWGSVAFQFYTYPMQMYSYLTRNFMTMIPYMGNKADKKAAATQFFGTLGMTGLFSGVVGMPMYSVTMGVAEAIRDMMGEDDDDIRDDPTNPLGKVNLDVWMRNTFIPKFFGEESGLAEALGLDPEAARLLSRSVAMGPVSALSDMNIGTSTSLDNMFIRNEIPIEDPEEAFKTFIYGATGAFGSMTSQMLSSATDFARGDNIRGIEKISPAFMRGGIKAFRLGTEGLKTSSKQLDIRDAEFYHAGKLFAQGLGFSSTEADETQQLLFQAKTVLVGLQKERTKLLSMFNRAVSYGEDGRDNEAEIQEALEDIMEFNLKYGIQPLAITHDTLSRSVEGSAQSRALGDALGGFGITESEIPIGAPLINNVVRRY
jgi:hypothetical protein